MALVRAVHAAKILQTQPMMSRPFHFLAPKHHADSLGTMSGVKKMAELNDYFTKHGGDGTSNFARAFVDKKANSHNGNKMTSLPEPPPLEEPKFSRTALTKPKSQSDRRVRVCHNRTSRVVVKPIRVPIVIDIKNNRDEPKPVQVVKLVPPPPPVKQTLSQRLLALSKDAAWMALTKAKDTGLAQMRKIEPPQIDAVKLKKFALIGGPLLTSVIGYLYGKFS